MNKDQKMLLGYIVSGSLVIVLVPSIILITISLFDHV